MSARRITDPARFGRVAVLMGGWSSERAVSLDSGAAVAAPSSTSTIRFSPEMAGRAQQIAIWRQHAPWVTMKPRLYMC